MRRGAGLALRNAPVKVLDLNVEGPFMFSALGSDDKWAMVFDYFGGNQGRWGLAITTDMTNWTLTSNRASPYYTKDFYMPPGVRHGSVLPVTASESKAILEAFGSKRHDQNGLVQ